MNFLVSHALHGKSAQAIMEMTPLGMPPQHSVFPCMPSFAIASILCKEGGVCLHTIGVTHFRYTR